MRTIVCPECGGDRYTERFRGDQAFDRKPCEKCGGEGKIEDEASPAMLQMTEDIIETYQRLEDMWVEDFDDDYVVQDLLNDLGSSLYELQSQLKARCK